jgi:hypothetical protein
VLSRGSDERLGGEHSSNPEEARSRSRSSGEVAGYNDTAEQKSVGAKRLKKRGNKAGKGGNRNAKQSIRIADHMKERREKREREREKERKEEKEKERETE